MLNVKIHYINVLKDKVHHSDVYDDKLHHSDVYNYTFMWCQLHTFPLKSLTLSRCTFDVLFLVVYLMCISVFTRNSSPSCQFFYLWHFVKQDFFECFNVYFYSLLFLIYEKKTLLFFRFVFNNKSV